MQNKNLGVILIILSLIVVALLFVFKAQFQDTFGIHSTASCPHDPEKGELCPYEKLVTILPYFYAGISLLMITTLIGIYLLFCVDFGVIEFYREEF